jgi:hypothetical protein
LGVAVIVASLSSPSLSGCTRFLSITPFANRTRFFEVDARVGVEGLSSRSCFFPAADGIALRKGTLGGAMDIMDEKEFVSREGCESVV